MYVIQKHTSKFTTVSGPDGKLRRVTRGDDGKIIEGRTRGITVLVLCAATANLESSCALHTSSLKATKKPTSSSTKP